jgi:hypothetical protein
MVILGSNSNNMKIRRMTTNRIVALLCTVTLVWACTSKPGDQQVKASIEMNLKKDTVEVCKVKYIQSSDTIHDIALLILNDDTVFKTKDYYTKVEFVDFNHDGCADIKASVRAGESGLCELYLFDGETKRFREVKNVFANPEAITNTKYYYSYERIGCSDNFWQSYLFEIRDFEVIPLGVIYGKACGESDDGILIHTIDELEEEKLFKKLPITIIGNEYSDKWDFIQKYWTKNYSSYL